VQNISHDAAQRYCAWITKVYNASPEKKKFRKVLFRLPTEQEWITAALGGKKDTPYPWGGYFVRNSKGCYLGNYNSTVPCGDCPGQSSKITASALPLQDGGNVGAPESDNVAKQVLGSSNDGGFFTVEADSYYPNDFGLYAVSGNVAEMVSEPGITKGGSWQDINYYGQIPVVQKVSGPSPAVGFRVFMEVIEE
jgi:formylglycine-generating enzyme required for sulfatase activity